MEENIMKLSISLKMRTKVYFLLYFFLLLFFFTTPVELFGWGSRNHRIISKQAYNLLPEWETDLLSVYGDSIVNTYCLYPDMYRRKEFREALKPYIEIPYIKSDAIFHHADEILSGDTMGNILTFDNNPDFYILTYFMEKSIELLKANEIQEAARHMGTLAHYIEDYCCPVHVVNNALLAQLLPPPSKLKRFRVHGVEGPEMENLIISDYSVEKLGKTLFEAVNNIIPRLNEMQLNSRAQAVPIIMGTYEDDFNKSDNARNNSAEPAVKLLADIWNTIFCLAWNK